MSCEIAVERLMPVRKGARRMREVPADVIAALSSGEVETVNLMEWLAADMGALARSVAADVSSPKLSRALHEAADTIPGKGVLTRLAMAGRAIASSTSSLDDDCSDFLSLSEHRSDLVRQWACYAVNEASSPSSLEERLERTLRFASDPNMSVREAAWMAFRPHIVPCLERAIGLLEPLTVDSNPYVRRFAVEVTRPRSVWGAHIPQLKREPRLAEALLRNVRTDGSRYVQLAAGNWLNDASKSRPDWVIALCERWSQNENPKTAFIVRRALRTLKSQNPQIRDLADIYAQGLSALASPSNKSQLGRSSC